MDFLHTLLEPIKHFVDSKKADKDSVYTKDEVYSKKDTYSKDQLSKVAVTGEYSDIKNTPLTINYNHFGNAYSYNSINAGEVVCVIPDVLTNRYKETISFEGVLNGLNRAYTTKNGNYLISMGVGSNYIIDCAMNFIFSKNNVHASIGPEIAFYADSDGTELDGTIRDIYVSPDEKIAMVCGAFTGRNKLYSLSDSTATYICDVLDDEGNALNYGTHVFAISSDGSLWIIGKLIGSNAGLNAYSFDGETFTYIDALYADDEGTPIVDLFKSVTAINYDLVAASFLSNDSSFVFVARLQNNSNTAIAKIYSVNGTSVTYVSDIFADAENTPIQMGSGGLAVFSPDGNLMILLGVVGTSLERRVILYKIEGTNANVVCDLYKDSSGASFSSKSVFYNGAFSPDGKWFLMNVYDEGDFSCPYYYIDGMDTAFVDAPRTYNGKDLSGYISSNIGFSPDSSMVALHCGGDHSATIYAITESGFEFNSYISLMHNGICENDDFIHNGVFIGPNTYIANRFKDTNYYSFVISKDYPAVFRANGTGLMPDFISNKKVESIAIAGTDIEECTIGSIHSILDIENCPGLSHYLVDSTIARTADVIPTPATAQVGQTVVVKAVDESGKPTEWEAVDMSSGSGLPEGASAHQQLVTDGDGVAKWADIPDPIQADYAQNDPEQPDYIKNRLAYTTRERVTHEPVTIEIYNLGYATLPYEFFPGNGEEYTVDWDGTDYTVAAAITTVDEEEVFVAGNTSFFGGSTNTDIPFGIISRSGRALVYPSEFGEHTISLTGYEQIPHKIPREYVDHNPIVGVIDSSYYNCRYLNPAKGASIAEVRQAAVEGNRDIIIRLDLDNWQGTLRYMGLTNVSTDGTNYVSAMLFSTIKANNVSINDHDEAINGTMQLEYWYALLEPAEGPIADAFVNLQFAEINLAPGTAEAGSYMRVNEKGFWEVAEGPEEFSGSYNDLTDKPEIPSSWSDFGDREMEYLYHGTIVIENGTAEITGLRCPDNGVEVAVILTSEDGNAIYGSAMKYVYNSMANVSEYRYVSGHKVFDKIDCTSVTRIGMGSEMDDGNWILEIYDPNQDRINEIPSKFLPATVPAISSASVGQTIVVKAVDKNGKPTEWEAADAGGGMPEGGEPFQQLVTDAEGNVKWEEPLARIGGHIEWRGNHDDDGLVYLEVDEFDMAPLVKVSNDILPVDKIGCAFLVAVEGINTGRMPIENEYINNNGTYWWTDSVLMVCILETTTFSNGVVGEPGVYFLDLRKLDESLYVSDLYYDVEQLNSALIPDDIARTYDIPQGLPYYAKSDEYKYKQLVLNQNACPVWIDMLLYDFGTKEESLGVTSTLIPTPERQSRTDRIVYRGEVSRLFELEVGSSYNVYSGASANSVGYRTWTCYMGSNGYPVIGNHAMLSPDNDVTYQDNVKVEHYFLLEDRADEGLTYLYTNTSENRYYTFSKIIPDIKLLDEQFIPDTIARVSDIPETLTETRVNELIDAKIAAIPAAEEASF